MERKKKKGKKERKWRRGVVVKGHRWFYIERVSKKEKEGKKGERKGKQNKGKVEQ